jgi:aryl-alcohol dehydrogenase-like predicted oxidoreductase
MIEKQPFGRTGHTSTRIIFGAFAVGQIDQAQADGVLDLLLEYGINHIDTAPTYFDSELRIGPWMERHRQDFFLATKTNERIYQKAREQIHQSLERLRVDHVDLLQLHDVGDPKEWEIVMGPGGALEAVIEAREQGLTRFVGVTGHGLAIPALHTRALSLYNFDSVLLPYNLPIMKNPQYADDFESLMDLCTKQNVAVQTIKSLAHRPWEDEEQQTYATWYKPIEDQDNIDRAMHWVLSRPGIFLVAAGDARLLPKVLDAASRFQSAPSENELQQMASVLEMKSLW